MKGDCPKCGFPLNKGNIQVVRPRGKKRPFRIHRRCPEAVEVTRVGDVQSSFVPVPPRNGGTADATRLQRPQDTTGGPLTTTVVLEDQGPRYRLFMTRDQAERVKASIERNASFGFGIAFEAIPVPDYQVENDPDAFANLVEVTVEWKN